MGFPQSLPIMVEILALVQGPWAEVSVPLPLPMRDSLGCGLALAPSPSRRIPDRCEPWPQGGAPHSPKAAAGAEDPTPGRPLSVSVCVDEEGEGSWKSSQQGPRGEGVCVSNFSVCKDTAH